MRFQGPASKQDSPRIIHEEIERANSRVEVNGRMRPFTPPPRESWPTPCPMVPTSWQKQLNMVSCINMVVKKFDQHGRHEESHASTDSNAESHQGKSYEDQGHADQGLEDVKLALTELSKKRRMESQIRIPPPRPMVGVSNAPPTPPLAAILLNDL